MGFYSLFWQNQIYQKRNEKQNTMTEIEFFSVVAKMRQAQKKYFAARSNDPAKSEWLKESKRLESLIDGEITQRLKKIDAALLKDAYKRFSVDYEPQQKLF